MGPGPANADPRILAAQSLPLLGHMHPPFLKIMGEGASGVTVGRADCDRAAACRGGAASGWPGAVGRRDATHVASLPDGEAGNGAPWAWYGRGFGWTVVNSCLQSLAAKPTVQPR